MPPHRFAQVQTWIFDLDNTLYPPSAGLLAQIDARITGFIARELALPPQAADRLRAAHWRRYGITLTGLVREQGIDPARYLEDVHAIDLSGLAPDPGLGAALAALPGRRIVHTNAARAHALRVLGRLGLGALFDGVYGIEDKGLVPKPQAAAYASVIEMARIEPERAAMIEDSARNLMEPRRLGMGTVWLNAGAPQRRPAHVDAVARDLRAFLAVRG